MMRKQYYFRQSSRGLLAWDVDQLVARTRDFPVLQIPLADIHEIREPFSSEFDEPPSWKCIVEHIRLIEPDCIDIDPSQLPYDEIVS